MGVLLFDPAEKMMYRLVSYSRLALLVKRNFAEFNPICLGGKVSVLSLVTYFNTVNSQVVELPAVSTQN